jgi:hypothetical protein
MAVQSKPEPFCSYCSKPIVPGTELVVRGEAVHRRCLTNDLQRRVVESQEIAQEARARALTTADRARELIEEARTLRSSPCPACARSLSDGSAVLFQGDILVHAACWAAG